MSKETAPWFKFYPRDWRADEELRVCSMAARGLWIEMLALMHSAKPYGHLLINEQPPTDVQLASLAGAPIDQVVMLLAELESTGVFSRTRAGTIYSRRMVRDEKRRLDGQKSAKEGKILGSRRSSQATEKETEKFPPPGWYGGAPPPYPTPQRPDSQRAERKENISSSEFGTPRAREDLDRIETLLRQASGLENDPSSGLLDLSPVLGLMDAGFMLEQQICPVIRTTMRKQKPTFRPRGWAYFVPAIQEAHGRRQSAAAIQATSDRADDERRWRNMLADERKRGNWRWKTPKSEIPAEFVRQWESEQEAT